MKNFINEEDEMKQFKIWSPKPHLNELDQQNSLSFEKSRNDVYNLKSRSENPSP